eukprot:TRINITY_DN65595_c2_g1_i1.p1 TRINITY_DN65595_c2_g1~~TRINITY_DN65595_c2_g1_i1.p1  ORF type:complete len:646 (-),score=322.72 TRINITY_DN65595_c2_g1_i1:280-2139(-)
MTMTMTMMAMMKPVLVVVAATAVVLSAPAQAAPLWGFKGHEMIGAVAQSLLTPSASAAVNKLLKGDTMASVAPWADEVKYLAGWTWSKPLHFIDTPDWACNYVPSRDCGDQQCVAGAILNYTGILEKHAARVVDGGPYPPPPTDLPLSDEAVRFLVHFVGDIHQPLHVSFGSDLGGNTIHGTYEGLEAYGNFSVNLHALWDYDMIQTFMNTTFQGSQANYINYLYNQIQGPWRSDAQEWTKCSKPGTAVCPGEWANETAKYACTNAYVDVDGSVIKNGFYLRYPYYHHNIGLINQQLAKAAVRLANVFNSILGKDEETIEYKAGEAQDEMPVVDKEAVNVPLWGNTGHQLTGYVAQQLLNSNAASQVKSILAGQTMEEVATWADQVKHEWQWKWTSVLHYINTPSWQCSFNKDQDCADQMCVYGAILNYTQQLTTTSGVSQQDALKFVIHFIGDIHQPLHVGFADDRGGNSITGTYDGHSTNLHAIWDYNMIDTRMSNDFGNSESAYGDFLYKQITGPWASQAAEWAKCSDGSAASSDACPDEWANESAKLACTNAYTDSKGDHVPNNFTLGSDYYNFNKDIIDQQLAKAAVRMASTLNKVWSGDKRADSLVRKLVTKQ